jgi:predicted nucleotidyltransferase
LRPKARTRDTETIKRLTELLIQAAKPNRIIMFGSQARGEAAADSDFDVMVVEEAVSDRAAEMIRLNRLLRSLDIPVDLLAVSAEKFNYWCDTPGNVISRRPPRVKSSMNMKQRDQARLLLRKAAQDEALLHEALTSDQEYQNG